MQYKCQRCQSDKIIKNGYSKGDQKYKCKDCGYQFVLAATHGKALEIKLIALYLYIQGVPVDRISKLFNVSSTSIYRWAQFFVEDHKFLQRKEDNIHISYVQKRSKEASNIIIDIDFSKNLTKIKLI